MAKRLTPIVCILLGVLLFWAASGAANAQAYVFPKLLAAVMVILGIAMAVSEWGAKAARKAAALDIPWGKLWPVLMIFVIYMVAAQPLGFYFASWLAFAAIGIVYSPAESNLDSAKRCVPISLAFLLVLYAVFVVLLQVQMPKGVVM